MKLRWFKSTTRAITKSDHTPQKLLVTKQINVTGMQNKRQQEQQIVTKYARLTPSYNHPRNFIAIASSLGDMHLTKFKYGNKQRAITQK